MAYVLIVVPEEVRRTVASALDDESKWWRDRQVDWSRAQARATMLKTLSLRLQSDPPFYAQLHDVATAFGLKTIKVAKDGTEYEYRWISPTECQFGRTEDIPTNYLVGG